MSNVDLYQGDCLAVMDKLIEQGVKVDSIITDPPYLISRSSGFMGVSEKSSEECVKKFGNISIDFGEWDNKEFGLELFINKSYSLLKDGGTLFMFFDIWKMQEVKLYAELVKFKQPRIGEWIKTNPVPINSKLNYLSNSKEYFATFVKKSKPTFNSKYDKAIYEYPICHGKERSVHPTQKPLALMTEIINKHTNEGDVILDPFMGSGSTGVACKNLNRNFIGIELDEEYLKIAEKRINNIK